jgi:hypothetical protein
VLQVVTVLKGPSYALAIIVVASLLAATLLYFDEFYFVSPYFVAYFDPGRAPVLLLDVAISAMSGIVITLSVYEIREYPDLKGSYRKTGFAGIVGALVAGACPCYYLVPVLAALGGAGGFLGALGILFFNYQIPIKLGSLGLLAFAGYSLERGLSAACTIRLSTPIAKAE